MDIWEEFKARKAPWHRNAGEAPAALNFGKISLSFSLAKKQPFEKSSDAKLCYLPLAAPPAPNYLGITP